jgi:hypothetical protein
VNCFRFYLSYSKQWVIIVVLHHLLCVALPVAFWLAFVLAVLAFYLAWPAYVPAVLGIWLAFAFVVPAYVLAVAVGFVGTGLCVVPSWLGVLAGAVAFVPYTVLVVVASADVGLQAGFFVAATVVFAVRAVAAFVAVVLAIVAG